jgi:hypothetical protein
MATTVEIILKGVGICYEKKDTWKILFPFNECHSVKFSCRKNDEKLTKIGHLAMANCRIDVNVSPERQNREAKRSPNFEKYVLDLTHTEEKKQAQDSSGKVPTHGKVRVKKDKDKKEKWREKAVLLSLQNAEMSVLDYIEDYTDEDILLHEVDTPNRKPIEYSLAHWLRAKIDLQPNEELTVKRNNSELLKITSTADKDIVYTLTFDNDCVEVRENQNDMDMYYQIVEDAKNPKRRFRLVSASVNDEAPRVIPPGVRGDKPCMFVYVSDPDGDNNGDGSLPE